MNYDVIIIGAGPGGLSAAINAAAEGLSTLVLYNRFGGQAGGSSRLENVLGFPEGISGPILLERASAQARRLGADIEYAQVSDLEFHHDMYVVRAATGIEYYARSVVLACGVQYRRPDWAKLYEGHGVHYAATPSLIRGLTRKDNAAVVGGGNSSGQATEFLAEHYDHVDLIVRGPDLSTMSKYLFDRISNNPRVDIHYDTEVDQLTGDRHLQGIHLNNGKFLRSQEIFVMIGADPNCNFADWISRDKKGFVVTDNEYRVHGSERLYAIGDLRADNIKRAASAIGEGAACIQSVFRDLKS